MALMLSVKSGASSDTGVSAQCRPAMKPSCATKYRRQQYHRDPPIFARHPFERAGMAQVKEA